MTASLEVLGRDTALAKVGAAEWAGACPWCGGQDRFRVWPDGQRPRFWCRQCDRKGDAIDYLRERDGLSFAEARDAVGSTPRQAYPAVGRPTTRPVVSDPPSSAWQASARAFVEHAEAALWSPAGERALTYLRAARGLHDDTIRKWRLGFHAERRERPAERWGLEGRPVWLERGIVVPCEVAGVLWSVKVRRPMLASGDQPDELGQYIGGPLFAAGKYIPPRGYRPALFGAGTLQHRDVAVLVEGEFDAMVVAQQAGDLVGAVTMGAADAPIGGDWLLDLCRVRRLLSVYDNDAKGQQAGARMAELSGRIRALRWPEGVKDATEMHVKGGDLRSWVQYQIEHHAGDLRIGQQADAETEPEPRDPCPACGQSVWCYSVASGWSCPCDWEPA